MARMVFGNWTTGRRERPVDHYNAGNRQSACGRDGRVGHQSLSMWTNWSMVTCKQCLKHYGGGRISFDAVVELLHQREVPAFVQQTGGGCATIYVGQTSPDAHGDERYELAVGPGWFEGPGWTRGAGWTGDLYAGPDDGGSSGVDDYHCFLPGDTAQTVVDVVTKMLLERHGNG